MRRSRGILRAYAGQTQAFPSLDDSSSPSSLALFDPSPQICWVQSLACLKLLPSFVREGRQSGDERRAKGLRDFPQVTSAVQLLAGFPCQFLQRAKI